MELLLEQPELPGLLKGSVLVLELLVQPELCMER